MLPSGGLPPALGFLSTSWRLSPESVFCDGANGRPGPAALCGSAVRPLNSGLWSFPEHILPEDKEQENTTVPKASRDLFFFFYLGQGMIVTLQIPFVLPLVVGK